MICTAIDIVMFLIWRERARAYKHIVSVCVCVCVCAAIMNYIRLSFYYRIYFSLVISIHGVSIIYFKSVFLWNETLAYASAWTQQKHAGVETQRGVKIKRHRMEKITRLFGKKMRDSVYEAANKATHGWKTLLHSNECVRMTRFKTARRHILNKSKH